MSQLLGTTDVAIKLQCSAEWVRRLADKGELPAERTAGGQRIFRAEDVERLASEREQLKRERAAQ